MLAYGGLIHNLKDLKDFNDAFLTTRRVVLILDDAPRRQESGVPQEWAALFPETGVIVLIAAPSPLSNSSYTLWDSGAWPRGRAVERGGVWGYNPVWDGWSDFTTHSLVLFKEI